MKRLLSMLTLSLVLVALVAVSGVSADSVGTGFEPTETPAFSTGNINQNGWSCTGPYDIAIVENGPGAPSEFQTQSLRISNSVTSGSFGDQLFSKSLSEEAGETEADGSTYSTGPRQSHFEAQFSLASFTGTLQENLAVSVSPDRGDGARMSYLRFEDRSDGIHVLFVDVQDPAGNCPDSAFVESDIATVDRNAHMFKFVMDFVDGPHNDVVRIYIDGRLKHNGTSWEDYYRYCAESHSSFPTRTVDSLLFREGGAAITENAGKGFLVDNVTLTSGPSYRDCRNGNWANFTDPTFRNQGQCVSYFQSHPQ